MTIKADNELKSPFRYVLKAILLSLIDSVIAYLGFVYIPYMVLSSLISNIPMPHSVFYGGFIAFFFIYFVDRVSSRTPMRILISMLQGVIILYIFLSVLRGGIVTGKIEYHGTRIYYEADIRLVLYPIVAFGFIVPLLTSIVGFIESRIKKEEM